jgi:tetratricopeptide (TPR) repeat protein
MRGRPVWDLSRVAATIGSPGEWDFFLSYAQADRAWAEWIAGILEAAGYRVFIQAWDSVPGSNWLQAMQAGTRDAARVIAVLSHDYLDSVYCAAEWQAAWARDPDGTGRLLLTVRVTACDRPGLLAGIVGMDLFGLGEREAAARLLSMVAAAETGRGKPPTSSGYPGSGQAIQAATFPGAAPRAWNLPRRNPNFAGRRAELSEIAEGLKPGSSATALSLIGTGGIGKTQLAVEHAYAHAADYEVAWWISADEPDAIMHQFSGLAKALNIDPVWEPRELAEQISIGLRNLRGWLLIFDDADSAEDVEPWLPTGPAPAGVPSHVIITSPRAGFTGLGPVVPVAAFELADAAELICARVRDLPRDDAELIGAELERMPVAVEQAASYLSRSRISGAEYLRLLRAHPGDLCMRGLATRHGKTVNTRWDATLQGVRAESRAAAELLGVCAYLGSEPIPLDLFTAHTDRLTSALSLAAKDALAWNDVLAVLVNHSLAERSTAGLRLHRFVQAAVRAHHKPSALQGRDGPLAMALRLLRADAPSQIAGVPESWPHWAVLLPHVQVATSFLEEFAGQPAHPARADGSWLLDGAGTYLQARARLTESKQLLERALSITETACGPNHPEVANHLNNLATVLKDLGQPEAALPLLERALSIDQRCYGSGHPNLRIGLNNLAAVLQDLNQPEAALARIEQALKINKKYYGLDHPNLATPLRNLAMILHDLGEFESARGLQQRVLDIDKNSHIADHPTVALDLSNLARILQKMGQPEAALPLLEQALVINERVYGSDHPAVAASLGRLAGILRDPGLSKSQ